MFSGRKQKTRATQIKTSNWKSLPSWGFFIFCGAIAVRASANPVKRAFPFANPSTLGYTNAQTMNLHLFPRRLFFFFSLFWLILPLFGWGKSASTVRLAFVGDLLLERVPGKYISLGHDPFQFVAPVLKKADVRIGNLECVVADGGKRVDKHYTFRAQKNVLPYLKKYFEGVSLANNHSGDFGDEGFLEMFANLKSHSIEYFGAGVDKKEAHKPWIFKRNGITFGILGYNEFRPRSFEAGLGKPGVAWSNDEEVLEDIKATRPRVDVLITFMHWGAEYYSHPIDRQKKLARLMIDAGVDVVVGGHPHITEGTETYRGKLIVYSLGNFVFDDWADSLRENRPELEELSRKSWILNLEFKGRVLSSWDTVVTRTGDDGFPRIVQGESSPSSINPMPSYPEKFLREAEKKPGGSSPSPKDIQNFRLYLSRESPRGTWINQLSAYTIDKIFTERVSGNNNPHIVSRESHGDCELTRYDTNLPYEYPDPDGFDIGLESLTFEKGGSSLFYPIGNRYRDFPAPTFSDAKFVDWMGSSFQLKAPFRSPKNVQEVSLLVEGIRDFSVATDSQLDPKKDFHLSIKGGEGANIVRFQLGGYNTVTNLGYSLICNQSMAESFRLPRELLEKIPFEEVSQKSLNIGVELSRFKEVDLNWDPARKVRVLVGRRENHVVPVEGKLDKKREK